MSRLKQLPEPSLLAPDSEEWHQQTEECSKTIRQVLLSLIGACLFCLVTLGQTDVILLEGGSTVNIPFTEVYVAPVTFLRIGPLVLIGLTLYLHVLVEHWISLNRVQYRNPRDLGVFPPIPNIDITGSKLLSWFLLDWMVPLVLGLFTWRAAPEQSGAFLFVLSLTAFTFGILILLQARLFYASNNGRNMTMTLVFCLALISTCLLTPVLLGSHFRSLNLSGTNLREKDLRDAYLPGVILSRAYLTGAKLQRANLEGADLTGAILNEAHMARAKLRGAKLEKAFLNDAELGNASLLEAVMNGADLRRAKLKVAMMSEAHLEHANLSNAELDYAFLSMAYLNCATLNLTKLTSALLANAHLRDADLREADLSRADLTDADLSGANLGGADLSDADLSGANLGGADLSDAMHLTIGQIQLAKKDGDTMLPAALGPSRQRLSPDLLQKTKSERDNRGKDVAQSR